MAPIYCLECSAQAEGVPFERNSQLLKMTIATQSTFKFRAFFFSTAMQFEMRWWYRVAWISTTMTLPLRFSLSLCVPTRESINILIIEIERNLNYIINKNLYIPQRELCTLLTTHRHYIKGVVHLSHSRRRCLSALEMKSKQKLKPKTKTMRTTKAQQIENNAYINRNTVN